MEQKTGLLATFSIVAALGSFLLSFTGSPLWGILVAIIAIPLGIGGFVMAASPRVSGGILSIFAMVLGVIAIGIAVLALIF